MLCYVNILKAISRNLGMKISNLISEPNLEIFAKNKKFWGLKLALRNPH
jgi:hypothetical protein